MERVLQMLIAINTVGLDLARVLALCYSEDFRQERIFRRQ